MQLSTDTFATGAELFGGRALRVLFTQKWSSPHCSHVSWYQKNPGRHVHALMPALPSGDVLLPGHACLSSAPAQYESAPQGSHVVGLVFSRPARHVQFARAVAVADAEMCFGHGVHLFMLLSAL